MKIILTLALMVTISQLNAQSIAESPASNPINFSETSFAHSDIGKKDITVGSQKWHITHNHIVTGGFVFLAGMAKGFNETLQFHWKEFHRQFPKANPQWYYPTESWKNKYKNGDPNQGPKYFLSTSVLIMFTDQYHL